MGLIFELQSFFLNWYVLLLVVIVLIYFVWKHYQKTYTETLLESDLLILEIPKTNDKSELAAEQLFASLHGILRNKEELKAFNNQQEHLSCEIASVNGRIRFYVWVPKTLRSFVEGQIYAQYPTVQIYKAEEDYVDHVRNHGLIYCSELNLSENEVLPIKTFQNFEVDPLAGITGTLAKLESTGEEIWVQILIRPIADSWHKKTDLWIKSVKQSSSKSGVGVGILWFVRLFSALWQAPEMGDKNKASTVDISERDKTRIAEAEKKATKLGYEVKIRIVYLGENSTIARQRMQAIVGTFKQFNSTNLNGFVAYNNTFERKAIEQYRSRLFGPKGFVLNIEELASVFHLPHTNVETPNIVWASSKTAEPPAKLPIITGQIEIDENISAFGLTNFRGINHQFGIYRKDRDKHIYVVGQTGSGKSKLLELFALSDIFHGHGYAIIDPHGDFAVNNMRFIPGSRLKDVVYFNPADTEFPLGFNPLELSDPNHKTNISSEVIGVLKRMFGDVSWGPRLEYILRYTILALLDRPSTTMLDITRMLTDKQFRNETLNYCQDTVVLNFWKIEFASWNERFAAEAIAPVLNKVGAFIANPIIRNIIGQPKSTFNIRQIMDEGKILIVNLSKGLIGEDNAAILGSFIVTKIQLAAMSRSDIVRVEDRRQFYLYVDEFQNFATDSFAVILSEARKYGLYLVLANQYTSQMIENVKNAVFGNVGTIISFRVSPEDAPLLIKQFEPQFDASDLLQLHSRHFIISMVIDSEKVPAFSATTLAVPSPQIDNIGRIIEHTRINNSRSRQEIEKEISVAIRPPQKLANQQQQNKQVQPEQPKPTQTQTAPSQPMTVVQINNQPRKKRSRSRKHRSNSQNQTPQTESNSRVETKKNN